MAQSMAQLQPFYEVHILTETLFILKPIKWMGLSDQNATCDESLYPTLVN